LDLFQQVHIGVVRTSGRGGAKYPRAHRRG
jgi:hypothetical protein